MTLFFGDLTFDPDGRLLMRNGQAVHLSRKAFDALALLIQRRPAAVTKDDLHRRLWPGTFVVDANLSVTIAEVRRALGDDPQAPRFIRTVHRVGYAFCGEVRGTDGAQAGASGPVAALSAAAPAAWLAVDGRVLRLEEGENIIGRDPGCSVWLDASGVSRRHARLVVERSGSRVEDLGSKNGTFLNAAPVTSARPVKDGDLLQLGPVQLVFHTSWRATATETVRIKGAP